MIRRAFLSTLLALSLVLTGLTSVVAETRMAASGTYCGPGAPQLLLDAAGLPHLDANGQAVAAPDCPACTIAFVALAPLAPTIARPTTLTHPVRAVVKPPLSPLVVHLGGQARAPPHAA